MPRKVRENVPNVLCEPLISSALRGEYPINDEVTQVCGANYVENERYFAK